ncbi:class I tRNA ligase family protein [Chitinophaga sedimenti]|uniref:class I tRNA ligase family protein n=1 Tax=Chitinophaga sedimenti TaxID=2033606 RepID=UPI0020056224|nr:class I tRNA ligase family protein [Chitinophaga sedimenti]MCK7559195.1 class I tRNA ligase family protein [Chitinophaga sedimenti]
MILLTPYAPHISEELWSLIGNSGSILDAAYPVFNEQYVTESAKEYPVSINGKMRTTINISLDVEADEAGKIALANEIVQKWLEGKEPKKIIFVKGKMINIVI